MEMSQLSNELRSLKDGEHKIVYESKKGVKVTVTQTGKFSDHDYAVGLIVPGQSEFYPTHIRLLIDLYIKSESNSNGFKKLHNALENVFEGSDPVTFVDKLHNIDFPMHLDESEVNLYIAQLLMIEQDFNFGPGAPKKSKFDPPREYLMMFLRWVASRDTQIDRIIFAAAGRKYPAPKKYSTPIRFEE
jgi:hypothetical protein